MPHRAPFAKAAFFFSVLNGSLLLVRSCCMLIEMKYVAEFTLYTLQSYFFKIIQIRWWSNFPGVEIYRVLYIMIRFGLHGAFQERSNGIRRNLVFR